MGSDKLTGGNGFEASFACHALELQQRVVHCPVAEHGDKRRRGIVSADMLQPLIHRRGHSAAVHRHAEDGGVSFGKRRVPLLFHSDV